MNTEQVVPKDYTILFNRLLYAGFWLLSGLTIWLSNDWSTAVANLGIALAFDPFDPAVTWKQRPWYQKVWLTIHLALVAAGFGYLMGKAL